jgi:hypothetical protein
MWLSRKCVRLRFRPFLGINIHSTIYQNGLERTIYSLWSQGFQFLSLSKLLHLLETPYWQCYSHMFIHTRKYQNKFDYHFLCRSCQNYECYSHSMSNSIQNCNRLCNVSFRPSALVFMSRWRVDSTTWKENAIICHHPCNNYSHCLSSCFTCAISILFA